jgi:hypothetical protein
MKYKKKCMEKIKIHKRYDRLAKMVSAATTVFCVHSTVVERIDKMLMQVITKI